MSVQTEPRKNTGILAFIERIGNKIPDITILFIDAFLIVCVISAILSTMTFDQVNPATGKPLTVINMLSAQSLVTF